MIHALPGEVAEYCRSMRVTRDVAFFFHEQAEYDFVLDDLDYSFFPERYWDALVDVPDMTPEVQRGCLALLYAMAMCEAGNVGVALGERLPACHARLATCVPQDEVSGRLKELALEALSVAATDQSQRDWVRVEALLGQAEVVHRLAVRPYFDSEFRYQARGSILHLMPAHRDWRRCTETNNEVIADAPLF